LRTLLVLNPHAAGGKAAALAKPLKTWLAKNQPDWQLAIAHNVAIGRRLIDAMPQGSRIVLVGGDGTFNQMLPSLLAGQHSAALVPYGSGNDLARALGLRGLSWRKALALAGSQTPQRMDIGLAEFEVLPEAQDDQKNDQLKNQKAYQEEGQNEDRLYSVPFASSFTTGFDSSVGLRALNGPKWLRGLPRYLLATVRELMHFRKWGLVVLADGKPIYTTEALFASTLNTPTFGAGMPAVPHASIYDGQLNLLLAKNVSVWQTLLLLPDLLFGKHLNHPKVHTQPFQTLQIKSDTPIPLAADGEYLGTSQNIHIRILKGQLPIVAKS
jgi:diacylglycerol kinase (ATP)